MRSRQLEKLLADFCPVTGPDLAVRGGKLREKDLLPVGGRGPHAPLLAPEHVSNWLLAVAGERKAVDAALAVEKFSPLIPIGSKKDAFERQGTLANALAVAATQPDIAKKVLRIAVWNQPDHKALLVNEQPYAEIRWIGDDKVERVTRYADKRAAKLIASDSYMVGNFLHHITIIGTALLVEIAARFTGAIDPDEPGGWSK